MSFSDEMVEGFISESAPEKENLRNLLIEGVIDRQKIMDKQQFVQVIQAMLIRLLDKLHTCKQGKELDNKVLCLYSTISEHLEEVLNFIEDFFSSYFFLNEKVPAPYLLISLNELCRQLLQLQERMDVKRGNISGINNYPNQKLQSFLFHQVFQSNL